MRRFLRHYILSVKNQVNTDVLQARWAIIFIIAYFAFLRKFFYSTCPVVVITGFPCPACGMTRAAFQLINLDFSGAFKTQPFIYVVSIIMILFFVNRYILLKKTPEWLKWMTVCCVLGMIVFYIWRMITCFPGEPPMSYYQDNLLAKMLRLIRQL